MALQRNKPSVIPADAVRLTEAEALAYQVALMKKWGKTSDTWGFLSGPYILAGASFASGFFLNNYYRKAFRLLHYGRASTYLPNCLLPTLLTPLVHTEFVMRDVLLQKPEDCSVCVEMRASAFQSFLGLVFPTLLAHASSMAMSHRYATYNMPYITSQPKEWWQMIRKINKPMNNILFIMFIGHALIGSAVTYLEAYSVNRVNTELSKLEERLEREGSL